MLLHEPPLITLLEGKPETQRAFQIVSERIHAVAGLLKQGKNTEGAELFVETIAFGPGAWKTLAPELQQTFIFNAPTWLDELQDDESLRLDTNKLKDFSKPVFISQGELSPPFFPLVIYLISAALPHAQRETFPGAGHIPHISHPKEYVKAVTDFIFNQFN